MEEHFFQVFGGKEELLSYINFLHMTNVVIIVSFHISRNINVTYHGYIIVILYVIYLTKIDFQISLI